MFVRKYHYIYECISNYQQVYIEQHAVCITDLEKWCWCQAQLLWQWKCQEERERSASIFAGGVSDALC